MNREKICKKYGITESQFFGIEKIIGYLDLSSLTSIPEGFNPTVGGPLDLSSLTSIPEGFNPTVGGALDLSSLTSIPEGFNPTVGGPLDLSSLTSIPEGFNPTVGGALDLRSLTSIPEGFNPTVGGTLYLSSLTSIPEGFNPTVGGTLYLSSLTSIPEGFNPTVGGTLYLSYNLYCKTKKCPNIVEWCNGQFKLIDGILTEIISTRGKISIVKIIGQQHISYLVTDGKGKYSHGKSIKEAKLDLMFKISDREKSEYTCLTLDSELSLEKAIECYRVITGACAEGTKHFVKSITTKKKYSISEIISATTGKYGNREFSNFFIK